MLTGTSFARLEDWVYRPNPRNWIDRWKTRNNGESGGYSELAARGNTSANAKSGRGGSVSAPRLPAPDRSRAGRAAESTSPATAQRRSPPRAVPCAGPRGASTRGPARFPEESGDAALARSRRGRDRRPQPQAGPGLEVVGPPPCIIPGSKQARDDRHAGVRFRRPNPCRSEQRSGFDLVMIWCRGRAILGSASGVSGVRIQPASRGRSWLRSGCRPFRPSCRRVPGCAASWR